MALTGSEALEFNFGGRTVQKRNERLELSDGTLAGANIDLANSVQNLRDFAQIELEEALACATSVPASVIKRFPEHGGFVAGQQAHSVICIGKLNSGSVTFVGLV